MFSHGPMDGWTDGAMYESMTECIDGYTISSMHQPMIIWPLPVVMS